MGYELIEADKRLLDSVYLKIGGATPIGGFPFGDGLIEFQFPPKLTSDSKSISWQEYLSTFVYEPQFMWKGGRPRHLTITTTYIIGGPGAWDPQRVHRTLTQYKSYFYTGGPQYYGGAEGGQEKIEDSLLPIFELGMYGVTGVGTAFVSEGKRSAAAFRGIDVSIKPSEELINVDGSIYHLRSDVTLNLELVSNIQTEGGTHYKYGNITSAPAREWY